jgi:hypothetical protein
VTPSCQCSCGVDAIRRRAALMTLFDDKKYQECLSKWMNWFEATRDRRLGRIPNRFDVSK